MNGPKAAASIAPSLIRQFSLWLYLVKILRVPPPESFVTTTSYSSAFAGSVNKQSCRHHHLISETYTIEIETRQYQYSSEYLL